MPVRPGLMVAVSLASLAATAAARPVESCYFKASRTAPVFQVPAGLEAAEAVLRVGLGAVPEADLVQGALRLGGGAMGLSPAQQRSLSSWVELSYGQLMVSPAFAVMPSALPYCLATERQRNGHYFMMRPDGAASNVGCLVVLHGDGGNLQLYTWALQGAFPKSVILAPSWGGSWDGGSPVYLREMLADARKRSGLNLSKPWLVGVSAGGDGGFAIYQQSINQWAGYISVAGLPPSAIAAKMPATSKLLLISGTQDSFLPIATARKAAAFIRKRVPALLHREVDGGHFLLIEKRRQTAEQVRAFTGLP